MIRWGGGGGVSDYNSTVSSLHVHVLLAQVPDDHCVPFPDGQVHRPVDLYPSVSRLTEVLVGDLSSDPLSLIPGDLESVLVLR